MKSAQFRGEFAMVDPGSSPSIQPEILAFYNRGNEQERLQNGIGPIEFARNQELIERHFPPVPAVVFDIGGGPGRYSLWLARRGYEVTLIDPVPLHIEQAQQVSAAQPDHPIAHMEIGDARKLNHPVECADAVLLHGPMYHLVKKADRMQALREVRRILKPGGRLLAVGVSRYASLNVGFTRWFLNDPAYYEMCMNELRDGVHLQPPTWPNLFTTAYFHLPAELSAEIAKAGFVHEETLAVQGMGWLVPDFEEIWGAAEQREILLQIIRVMEKDPVALGMSPHLMAVAHKP
jgi:ubiquinone/menaquinone biosynthesis C-methylase UbiE